MMNRVLLTLAMVFVTLPAASDVIDDLFDDLIELESLSCPEVVQATEDGSYEPESVSRAVSVCNQEKENHFGYLYQSWDTGETEIQYRSVNIDKPTITNQIDECAFDELHTTLTRDHYRTEISTADSSQWLSMRLASIGAVADALQSGMETPEIELTAEEAATAADFLATTGLFALEEDQRRAAKIAHSAGLVIHPPKFSTSFRSGNRFFWKDSKNSWTVRKQLADCPPGVQGEQELEEGSGGGGEAVITYGGRRLIPGRYAGTFGRLEMRGNHAVLVGTYDATYSRELGELELWLTSTGEVGGIWSEYQAGNRSGTITGQLSEDGRRIEGTREATIAGHYNGRDLPLNTSSFTFRLVEPYPEVPDDRRD